MIITYAGLTPLMIVAIKSIQNHARPR